MIDATAKPEIKPWYRQPGEMHDKRGVPIYPGDLLKTYHFTGARKKRYYLYHIAMYVDGAMRCQNTEFFGTGLKKHSSDILLQCLWQQDGPDDRTLKQTEVISGYGPGKCLSFEERPRVSVTYSQITNKNV